MQYANSPQEEHFSLPSDPNQAVKQTIQIIGDLKSVYIEETDALSKSDVPAFMSLQNKKLECARVYQISIDQLLKRKSEINNINPSLKQELQNMQKDFSKLADRNRRALERMNRSVERLGETIRNAVKLEAQRRQPIGYNHSGRASQNEQKALSTGISETA